MANKFSQGLYDYLTGKSARNIGSNADEFVSKVSNPQKLQQLYDYMQSHGAKNIGANADEFYTLMTKADEEPSRKELRQQRRQQRQEIADSVQQYQQELNPRAATTATPAETYSQAAQATRDNIDRETRRKIQATRLQETGLKEAAEQELKEATKAKRHGLLEIMSQAQPGVPLGITPTTAPKAFTAEQSKQVDDYTVTKLRQENLKNAVDIMDQVDSGKADLINGIIDQAARTSNWDYGVSNLLNAAEYTRLREKYESGEELTEAEQKALDAVALSTEMERIAGDVLGNGYQIGRGLSQSAAFMIQMASNPASGMGKRLAEKTAARALTKYGTVESFEKFGKDAIRKRIAMKAAATRVLGDAAEMAVLTSTIGAANVAADTMDRMNGDVKAYVDDNGFVQYDGVERAADEADMSPVKAFSKAWLSSYIENWTEAFGEYLPSAKQWKSIFKNGLWKMVDETRKKGIKVGRLDAFQRDLAGNPDKLSKWLSQARKAVKLNGLAGEIIEEELGTVLNAAFVGDNEMSDLKDLDNQIQIIASCAIMTGGFKAAELGSNIHAQRQYDKAIKSADEQGRKVFGAETWESEKEHIESLNADQAVEYLQNMMHDDTLTVDQKRAMTTYAAELMSYQTFNRATNVAMVGKLSKDRQDIIDAYNAGRNLRMASGVRKLYNELDAARAEVGGDLARQISRLADEGKPVTKLEGFEGFSKADIDACEKLMILETMARGLNDGTQDRADDATALLARDLDPVTRVIDGREIVTTAVFTSGTQQTPVYVLDINKDTNMATVIDAEGNKKPVSAKALSEIQDTPRAFLESAYRERYLSEELQRQDWQSRHNERTQMPEAGMTLFAGDGSTLLVADVDSYNGEVTVVEGEYDPETNALVPKKGMQPYVIPVSSALALQDQHYDQLDAEKAQPEAPVQPEAKTQQEQQQGAAETGQTGNGQNTGAAPAAEPVAEATDFTQVSDADLDFTIKAIQKDIDKLQKEIAKPIDLRDQNAKNKRAKAQEDLAGLMQVLQEWQAEQDRRGAAAVEAAKAQAEQEAEAARVERMSRSAAEVPYKEVIDTLSAMEPEMSFEDYVRFALRGAKIVWSSNGIKKGLKDLMIATGTNANADRGKYISWLANENNGGKYLADVIHSIYNGMPEQMLEAGYSDVDVRDIVMDALQSFNSPSALMRGLYSDLVARHNQAQLEYEQRAKDEFASEQGFADYEDYTTFNELIESGEYFENQFTEEEKDEIYSIIAQEYESGTEGSTGTGVQGVVQSADKQGTDNEGSSGLGGEQASDIEERDNGGAQEGQGGVHGAGETRSNNVVAGAAEAELTVIFNNVLTAQKLWNTKLRKQARVRLGDSFVYVDNAIAEAGAYAKYGRWDNEVFQRYSDAIKQVPELSRSLNAGSSKEEYSPVTAEESAGTNLSSEVDENARLSVSGTQETQNTLFPERDFNTEGLTREQINALDAFQIARWARANRILGEELKDAEHLRKVLGSYGFLGDDVEVLDSREAGIAKLRELGDEKNAKWLEEHPENKLNGFYLKGKVYLAFSEGDNVLNYFRTLSHEGTHAQNGEDKTGINAILEAVNNGTVTEEELHDIIREVDGAEDASSDFYADKTGEELADELLAHVQEAMTLGLMTEDITDNETLRTILDNYGTEQGKGSADKWRKQRNLLNDFGAQLSGRFGRKTAEGGRNGISGSSQRSGEKAEGVDRLEKRPLLWEGSANDTPSTDAATANVTSRDAQGNSEQSGGASNQSKNPEVYTRPAVEPGTDTDSSGVDSGNSNGVTAPAGNSPQTSADKDTKESDTQNNNARLSVTQRTDKEKQELFDAAKNKFGTTTDFREAGYLLPDGSLLDFSEKNDGGQPGTRNIDRRAVSEIMGGDYETRTDAMSDFVHSGAIRLMPENASINLANMPTAKQTSALQRFIRRYDGEVILEIDNQDGKSDVYAEYMEHTSPTRVINDIKGYFENGVRPTGNVRFSVSGEEDAKYNERAESTAGLDTDISKAVLKDGDIKLNGAGRFKLKSVFRGIKVNGLRSIDYTKVEISPYSTNGNVYVQFDPVIDGFGTITVPRDYVMEDENGMRIDSKLIVKELKWMLWQAASRFNKGYVAYVTDPDRQYGRVNSNDIRFSIANSNQRIFISNAAKAVEGIQQNKATADQWLAMLQKNGGLKAGEDKWLGLSEWLRQQGAMAVIGERDKTITKDEIEKFIAENAIRIEETRYAEYPESTTNLQDEVLMLWRNGNGNNYDKAEQVQKQLAEKYGDSFNDAVDIWYDGSFRVKDQAAYDRIFNKDGVATANSTRLEYTSEGLDNKREIALTVPTIEPYNKTDDVHFGDAGEGRAIAWVRFGETELVSESGNGDTKLLKEYEDAKAESDAYEKQLYDKYGIPYDDSMESFEKFVMSMTEEENAEWNRLSDAEIEAERKSVDVKRKKVLVIDEIQSKRHQDGRERGYITDSEAKRKALREERERLFRKYNTRSMRELERLMTDEESTNLNKLDEAIYGVPDAPFDKNWHELAMKRMLRLAAEEGYDKVAWTSGEQQAERYDIGDVFDSIRRVGNDFYLFGGSEGQVTISVDSNNRVTNSTLWNVSKGASLSDVMGKELALRMTDMQENEILELRGKRIGGEGMKGFYDQILPAFMNKYGKKWGVKVEGIELPDVENGKYTFHSVDVTPEMKESVMQGQAMFRINGGKQKGNSYICADGERIEFQPLLFSDSEWNGTVVKNVDAGSSGVQRKRVSGENTPVGLKLRTLQPGEFCSVERRYTENNHYSFTSGKNKVKTYEDVAYIFKSLQDKAVESAFAVLVKDGKPTIFHLGIGGFASVPVDFRTIIPAVNDINPDEIYMVHNHPSGGIMPSRADAELLYRFHKAFGADKVMDGVIIDSFNGTFSTFGSNTVKREMPETMQGERKVNVYSFDKQVYIKNNPTTSVHTSKDIAEFVTTERLGIREKIGALVISQNGFVVGNIYLPYNLLDGNADAIAKELSDTVVRMGGTAAVLYGNNLDIKNAAKVSGIMQKQDITLLDAVDITNEVSGFPYYRYTSAADKGLMEANPVYQKLVKADISEAENEEGTVRFRIVTDQKLLERLDGSKTVKVYRAMAVDKDGNLIPPMAGKGLSSNGRKAETSKSALRKWEQSDENLNVADWTDGDEYAHIQIKDDAGGNTRVAYNPYIHTSLQMLNDQFAKAWRRPNMVVVECEVPVWEADVEPEKAYKAKGAKNHVGRTTWTDGPVSRTLKASPREVILTRYAKPVRIVPMDEYAASVKQLLEKNGVLENGIPFSNVTPEQRDALYAAGVPISEPVGSGRNAKSMEAYNKWKGEHPTDPTGTDGDIYAMAREAKEARLSSNIGKDETGKKGQAMISVNGLGVSKTPDEFDSTLRVAIDDKGIVADNLANTKIEVVDVPKHDFTGTGNEAIAKAKKWASEHLVGIHKIHEGRANEYTIEINGDLKDGPIGKFLSKSATGESDNLGVHLAVLKKLLSIIDSSIDAEIHPDYKKINGTRSLENGIDDKNLLIHRLYGAVNIDNVLYRTKTTIKEYRNSNNEPYSYQVTEVEAPISGSYANDALSSSTSVSGAKLLEGVEKSYDKGKKLLDESKVQFSATPAQDAEYMEAVNSGDMKKAGKMVRDAFKAAYPDTKVVDENGMPMVVYHGASDTFNVFEIDRIDVGNELGIGFYFTDSKETAEDYTKINGDHAGLIDHLIERYLDEHSDSEYDEAEKWVKEHAFDNARVVDTFLNISNPYRIDDLGEFRKLASEHDTYNIVDYLKKQGYDGIIDETYSERYDNASFAKGIQIVVFNSDQIKSAAPVTYDDNGNVIPLSQRFNEDSNDIRFRISMPEGRKEGEEVIDYKTRVYEHFNNAYNPLAPSYAVPDSMKKDEFGKMTGFTDLDLDALYDIIVEFRESEMEGAVYISGPNIIVYRVTGKEPYIRRMYASGFFHENFHAYVDVLRRDPNMGKARFDRLLENMARAAEKYLRQVKGDEKTDNFVKDIHSYYSSEDWNEETITYAIGDATAFDRVDVLKKYCSEYSNTILDDYLNRIGYEIQSKNGAAPVRDSAVADDRRGQEVGRRGETSEAGQVEGSDGIRFSVSVTPTGIRAEFDNQVDGHRITEVMQDYAVSIRSLQEVIAKHTGPVRDWENAYKAENKLTSVNRYMMDEYKDVFLDPMNKAHRKLVMEIIRELRRRNNALSKEDARNKAIEMVDKYLVAKHGLERNEVFARRDAEKEYDAYIRLNPNGGKTVADFYNEKRGCDYSGLTTLFNEQKVSDAEAMASAFVSSFESRYNTKDLWDKINMATSRQLAISEDGGMISAATRQKIEDMFSYYIPLRGFREDISEDMYDYMGEGTTPFSPAVKTAKGRGSLADSPIATIANMGMSTILQANRNKVKLTMLRLAENHHTPLISVSQMAYRRNDAGVWEEFLPNIPASATESQAEQIMRQFRANLAHLLLTDPDNYKLAGDLAGIPYKVVSQNQKRQHEVYVVRDGVKYILTINGNPKAAQAINGQLNPETNKAALVKMTNWVNRNLAANFTTRNPAFVMSNLTRDAIYSNSMVWIKESPRYAANYTKNWALTSYQMIGLLHRANTHTLNLNDETDRLFDEFLRHGGETGYSNLESVEDFKGKMEKRLEAMQRAGVIRGAGDVLEALGDGLDNFNRWAELISRFACYRTSRHAGRSISRSVDDAKEVTVNFNTKGAGSIAAGEWKKGNRLNYVAAEISQLGRGLYVFWNAGVQGMTNLGKAAMQHKFKASAMMALWMGVGYVIAMLMSNGDDDDDKKNKYYNLPKYVRRNNLCFRVRDTWVTIPLAIEIRAMYGMGELAYSSLSGREYYSAKDLSRDIVSQMTQIMPIDMMEGGGGINALTPSSVKPFWELFNNVDWTGMPIYKDTPFNKNEPKWQKAYSSTNTQLVDFSRWLNENTGGSDHRSGWIDVNPAILEHLAEGYLGGVGTMATQTMKTAGAIAGKREFKWRNTPVMSRFINDGDERAEAKNYRNAYFEYKDEMQKVVDEVNGYKRDMHDTNRSDEEQDYAFGRLKELTDGAEYQFYQYEWLPLYKQIQTAREQGDKQWEDEAMRKIVEAYRAFRLNQRR